MEIQVKTIAVDWEWIINNDIDLGEIQKYAISKSGIKMQANGYPKVTTEILAGIWFVPTGTKYGTWLLLKYPNLKTGLILVGLE